MTFPCRMKLAGLVQPVTEAEIELARERVAIVLEAIAEPTDEQIRNAEGIAWHQIKTRRVGWVKSSPS